MKDKTAITLAEMPKGTSVTIAKIDDEEVNLQALRFGLEEGSQIRVETNIKGGPVIVSKNQLEIAVGRTIAQAIEVTLN